jgi:polyhydroxyalkanoate synthesis repressor PhaR
MQAAMRTFRRYSNRKLYDTKEGHYVSLAEIAASIRAGEDVRVLDHASGRDLTAATMAQIIYAEDKRGPRIGPGELLGIIRTGIS